MAESGHRIGRRTVSGLASLINRTRILFRRTNSSLSHRRHQMSGILFASPWLIGFALFVAYPIAASLYYSFCSYDAIRPPHFVGIQNYQRMFFEDDLFW